MDEPSLKPPLFLRYSTKVKRAREVTALAAGDKHHIVNISDKSGRLRYIHVNFEHHQHLRLWVILDGDVIFDYTAEEIKADGAGNMAVYISYQTAGMINTTRYTALNYSLTLDFNPTPLNFVSKCEVYVENTHTSEWDIQAYYALFDLHKG